MFHFLIIFYISVVIFVDPATVNKYFVAYPQQPSLVNWILSIFFHGSFPHLFSNALFLLFLGRAVEDKSGAGKWLLFYMMAGLVSVAADSFIRGKLMNDNTPLVGASGAVSGIAAVSAILSPFGFKVNRMYFPFPVFIIAWIMIYSDFINVFTPDNVAHWAHLAGFFSVFITAYFLSPEERKVIKQGFLVNTVFFTLTLVLLFFITNR